MSNDPCGNEDCDLCYPLPRFTVSTESVQRLLHRREIKAKDPEAALAIYAQGTAWPASYDESLLEVISEQPPKVELFERDPRSTLTPGWNCWHKLDLSGVTQQSVDALLEDD